MLLCLFVLGLAGVIGFGVRLAGAAPTAGSGSGLERACVLEGRSDGALLRGKQSPNFAPTIQQAFGATTDPIAKTAATAEAGFVQLVTSGGLKLSLDQLITDDPITGYCRAKFPAAYFSGSRIVSAPCIDAFDALVGTGPGATTQPRLTAERATVTACGSRGEWFQGATHALAGWVRHGTGGRGTTVPALFRAFCARNRDAAACRVK